MEQSDDTDPTILDTETLVSLRAGKGERQTHVPVLTASKSSRIWQQARWPLIALLIILFLSAVGFITNDYLVVQNIQRTITAAQKKESRGTVKDIQSASLTLSALAQEHPGRTNAQAAWAWQAVLEAVLLGPQPELAQKAASALGEIDDDGSGIYSAARAGLYYLAGKPEQALDLAEKSLKRHSKEPRLEIVRAWALGEMGRGQDAINMIEVANIVSPQYVPIVIAGIEIALKVGNRSKALDLIKKLQSSALGDYFYGSLATVAISLPQWAGEKPSAEQKEALLRSVEEIQPFVDSAPPKLALMGRSIIGRVYILVDRFAEAQKILGRAMGQFGSEKIFAWYALATMLAKGPIAALRLLDSRPDVTGPEVLDLRTQCLLDLHRVDSAVSAIKRLGATHALPERLKDLNWSVLVKKGDLQAAVANLPDVIDEDNVWPALELYYQLKQIGDRKSIMELIRRFDAGLEPCAKAIGNWHSRKTRGALASLKLDGQSSCVKALAGRLLRKHVEPQKLKQAIEEVIPQTDRSLFLDIDRAMVTWMVDGKVAAAAMLNGIWELKPQGGPLRCELAGAYIEMELPESALRVLDGIQTPMADALRIESSRLLNDGKAARLTQEVLKKYEQTKHPVLDFLYLQYLFSSAKYSDILNVIDEAVSHGGQWTAEIAEIGAKALNIEKDRSDADRFLTQTARTVGALAGMDESWEAKLALAQLNIRRGGKFERRAIYLLNEMENEGIVDPRVLYNLATLKSNDRNEKLALRRLKTLLAVDPTFRPAYARLEELGKMDPAIAAEMEKMWPK